MTALEAAPPSRSPWQWLYGAAHRWRYRWYASRQQRLPRPVVSIGNLHWGGSGKTPLVASIGRHWVGQGMRVAILSRGYGRRDAQIRVVSLGEGPLLGPTLAGDEPVLLAGEVRGAAVVVAPNRFDAGRHAMERLDPPPDLFLLDDGFSHLLLARDLDILVFPASDPFGGSRLWPGGRLREPLAAAARADAAILTGGQAGDGDALAQALRPYGLAGPGFGCASVTLTPRRTTGGNLPSGTRVLLVSGIGRPRDFEQAAARHEVEIVGALKMPDHHDYPEASLREIRSSFTETEAEYVLTTPKDRVKLLGKLDLPLAELPLRAIPDAGFWPWLDARLDALVDG